MYKRVILRHAWLSLLDKHMTTGRINQVSDFFKVFHDNRSLKMVDLKGKEEVKKEIGFKRN